MKILLMTSRTSLWEELRPAVEQRGGHMCVTATLEEGLAVVRRQSPSLVVLDLDMDAEALRTAVIDILQIDAMIHTAAVSAMSADEFHDRMEGLGMLMSLPRTPSTEDVSRLMAGLREILR